MKKTAILTMLLACAILIGGCGSKDEPQESERNKSKTEQKSESAKESGGSDWSVPEGNKKEIETFAGYIQASDYSKAIRYYQENISGNYDLESQALSLILSYCEDTGAKALSGEYGESEVRNRLGLIGKVTDGIGLVNSDYKASVNRINGALESKAAYLAGVDLETLKNYSDAMTQYKKVIEGDSNYSSAQEAIARCTDGIKQTAFAKAEELATAGDYIGAIGELKKAAQKLPEDSEIQSKITVYEKTYVSTSIESAESAFVTPADDWEKSLSIINAALQNYPDDAGLKEKKDYYSKFAPVNLYDVTPIKGEPNKKLNDIDTYKNERTNNFTSTGYGGGWSVTYDIQTLYNTFTAIVYGRSSETVNYSCYLRIYCDDKLVYENTRIADNGKSFAISVDLTGVSELTIHLEQSVSSYESPGFGLSDMYLQRTQK